MTVTVYGQSYECARADKGPDYVNLYDEAGTCIAAFSGISSFDGYTIEGGEWSVPPMTQEQINREAIEALIAVVLGGGV